MKPERIDEIAEACIKTMVFSDVEDLKQTVAATIKEALEEENRWYYPEKGELPINPMCKEFLVLTKTNSTRLCWFSLSGKFVIVGKEAVIIETEDIECWRYLPEMPGGEDD